MLKIARNFINVYRLFHELRLFVLSLVELLINQQTGEFGPSIILQRYLSCQPFLTGFRSHQIVY